MAIVSAAYGDVGGGGRAPTKSIYVRHIDSRNRLAPLTTSPSTYTYRVATAPLERVTTLQVGDVTLPVDARAAVDGARRHVGVSEPLRLASPSVLTVQETVTSYDRVTGEVVGGPTIHPPATVVLPPTLNRVVGVDDAHDTVTLAEPHGLAAVVAYWPPAVTPAAYFVASRMTAFTPQVSATTLHTTAPFPSPTQLTLTPDAVASYLAAQTTGAGGSLELEGVLIGTLAAARLYVAPLTIPEWTSVLTAALADMTAAGALRQGYALTMEPDSGCVTLQCLGGDGVTQRVRTETAVTFTVAGGDIMWRLGFRAGAWTLPTYLHTRIDSSSGLRADDTPYIMRVSPRDVRVIQVPRGNYGATELATALTTASNGIYLPLTATEAARTLTYSDVSGTEIGVLLPQGRYTPSQLAAYLTLQMNEFSTDPGAAAFVVTQAVAAPPLDHVGSGDSGGDKEAYGTVVYTFTDTRARPFSLNFSGADSGLLAAMLGFEPILYSGCASYTSPLGATSATSAVTPSAVDMRMVLTWTADTARRRMRVSAAPPIPSWEMKSAGLPMVNNTLHVAAFVNGSTPVVPHCDVGDVLTFYNGGVNNVLTAVVAAPADASVNPGLFAVDFGAIQLDVDLPSIPLLDAVVASPVGRRAFVLHMARPPLALRAAPENVTGAALFNAALERPWTAVGSGAAFGPLAEVVGWPLTATPSSEAGVALAPFAYALDPPPYLLLALLAPRATSGRATFRPVGADTELPVLAKFLVSSGFARVTEESTHVSFTSPSAVREVTVAWYNPDGTLVDWGGVNHAFSLLFRVWEGHAGGAAV